MDRYKHNIYIFNVSVTTKNSKQLHSETPLTFYIIKHLYIKQVINISLYTYILKISDFFVHYQIKERFQILKIHVLVYICFSVQ